MKILRLQVLKTSNIEIYMNKSFKNYNHAISYKNTT